MEESRHRLQITPRWNCSMVPSRHDVLRMEIVQSEFPSMDSWETSVVACPHVRRLMPFPFCSGCRKECPLVRCLSKIFPSWAGTYMLLISSTIIEDIEAVRKCGLASLAFFYCDFRDDQKKDLRDLLSSLLLQLSHQSDSFNDILSNLYLRHDRGSRYLSDDELVGCFKDLVRLPGQAPVYLVIDALDECPNTFAMPSSRDEVLKLLEDLVRLEVPNLRICVTSRPEIDIKSVLDPLTSHSVSLHGESGQIQDINDYIRFAVNTDSMMQKWKAEDKQLVINVLINKADGM
jgi:hypothetical protein